MLRGPQNSLFGRNTTGGAVNYISRQPVVGAEDAEATALLTYGQHNLIEIEGGVSLAARVDRPRCASRASITRATESGTTSTRTMTTTATRSATRCARTLAWEPSEAHAASRSVAHPRALDGEAQPQKMAGDAPRRTTRRCASTTLAAVRRQHRLEHGVSTPSATSPAGQHRGFRSSHHTTGRTCGTAARSAATSNVDGGYLKIEHDFGSASLTSITLLRQDARLLRGGQHRQWQRAGRGYARRRRTTC